MKLKKNIKYKFGIHSYVYPKNIGTPEHLKSIHRTCSDKILDPVVQVSEKFQVYKTKYLVLWKGFYTSSLPCTSFQIKYKIKPSLPYFSF